MSNITFTREELKEITDFVETVYQRAKFEFTYKEFISFNKKYAKVVEHIKKCESSIMELEEIVSPKKKQPAKRGPKPKEGK